MNRTLLNQLNKKFMQINLNRKQINLDLEDSMADDFAEMFGEEFGTEVDTGSFRAHGWYYMNFTLNGKKGVLYYRPLENGGDIKYDNQHISKDRTALPIEELFSKFRQLLDTSSNVDACTTIKASQYLYPDFDTAYKWDHEELRENLWFDCKNGQFLTFDEVLSIIGESTGLYRLQAKHEANYDLDEFIDKYLYGKNIFPYWYDEVIQVIADEFDNSSYNEVIEDMDNPIDIIRDFVYSTYSGITSKAKMTLSDDADWWFNEILECVNINYTDGYDWSEEAMLQNGADLYSTYGPDAGVEDMTDYDAESYLAYVRSLR